MARENCKKRPKSSRATQRIRPPTNHGNRFRHLRNPQSGARSRLAAGRSNSTLVNLGRDIYDFRDKHTPANSSFQLRFDPSYWGIFRKPWGARARFKNIGQLRPNGDRPVKVANLRNFWGIADFTSKHVYRVSFHPSRSLLF